MTDQTAAIATELETRIARAREAGVQIEVSVIDGDREDLWIVDADAATIDGDSLRLCVDQGVLDFPYAGPDALPVLPSIVAVDRAHALRAQAIAARDAVGRLDGSPIVVRFADSRNEAVLPSDLMHVASSGIYPPTVLGMDWSEVSAIRTSDDGMAVLSSRDGSVGFTMAAAA
jgi:hypothetical protein